MKISVCCAINDDCLKYLPYFEETLLNCSFVDEVVYCNIPEQYEIKINPLYFRESISEFNRLAFMPAKQPRNYKKGGIKFKHIPLSEYIIPCHGYIYPQHAQALHEALKHCSNDYIMFSDADMFFMNDVTKIYVDLMNRHKLNYVGISHYNTACAVLGYFPTVINMLTHRDFLPDESFMEEYLINKGQWLLPCLACTAKKQLPNEILNRFPNKPDFDAPGGGIGKLIDVGSLLSLWSEDKNYKWLSFNTQNMHHYTSKLVRSNINYKSQRPFNDVLWHSGQSNRLVFWDDFVEAFRKHKEEK